MFGVLFATFPPLVTVRINDLVDPDTYALTYHTVDNANIAVNLLGSGMYKNAFCPLLV